MPSIKDAQKAYDLIVIGSGPGGQKAALQGAKVGKRVAIIEAHSFVGGGCVHSGTIPSKSFRESVYRWSLGSRGPLGQELELHRDTPQKKTLPEMSRLLKRRDRVVSSECQIVYDQLKRNGVDIFHGHARFLSAYDVQIESPTGTDVLTTSYVMVATGARPVAPDHISLDGKNILDSNTILDLKKIPSSMVVLGAGIIGCEYASIFASAGCKVYLVDRRHEILASVDREIVNHLVERFHSQEMEILLGCEASDVQVRGKGSKGKGVQVKLSNDRVLDAEVVLVSQGRAGNTEGLGLDAAGIKTDDRGLIPVDQFYRTEVPHIYAVGDVVGPPALASTSMEQGRIACAHAFQLGAKSATEDYLLSPFFPYGIYTIPEISILGRTEEELVEAKVNFVCGRARYREIARGQIVGDRWGLLKLLVDQDTMKLLGVHIIGDSAADLIHIGQAVMTLNGDLTYFIQNVFNYPTLAEAYKTAAFHAFNQIQGAEVAD